MLSFVEKHLSFYPKEVRSFYVFFYSNEEKLNQQVCVIKYVENEIFNSIFHKKERGEKTYYNFKNIISNNSEKLSLVTLVSNYYKLSLKFEKRNWY